MTPEKIAAVMALLPLPHSMTELDLRVAQGLPKGALKASVERVCTNAEERKKLLYRIVPEATYKRRRDSLSADDQVICDFGAQRPLSNIVEAEQRHINALLDLCVRYGVSPPPHLSS